MGPNPRELSGRNWVLYERSLGFGDGDNSEEDDGNESGGLREERD